MDEKSLKNNLPCLNESSNRDDSYASRRLGRAGTCKYYIHVQAVKLFSAKL